MFNFENFTSRDMFARYESLDSEYNKSDLKYQSYYIEPGDIFYMSPGTIHQVVVEQPRATVLIDF